MKKLSILLIIILLMMVGCSKEAKEMTKTEVEEATINQSQFVTVKDGKFNLNNKPFRFAGTNNYYLNYKDETMIKDVFVQAQAMDLKVIRLWGFLDGMGDSMVGNNAFMQTEAGIYDQVPEGARSGFEALDYAIQCAAEHDIKLVIALTNNWDAFGGVNQYVKWSETATEHDDFFTDETTKKLYMDYVSHLINRVNTYTNIAYKDDPAIMTWELMNEPRVESDPSGETLYHWAAEMSAYVKSLDKNHLVALGDEGFFNRSDVDDSEWAYKGSSGVDFERNLSIETIDYGTFHLYPEHWGDTFDNPVKSGNKWIEEHAKAAEAVGKPLVLEEYGIQKSGRHNRDYVYESWLHTAEASGIDGTMFWILTGIDTGDGADAEGMYPDYDGFRIINDGGRTVSLLHNHAKRMAGEKVEEAGHIYIESPLELSKIKEVVAFKARVIENGRSIDDMTLELEGVEEVFDVSKSGAKVLDTLTLGYNGETTVTMKAYFDDGSVAVDQIDVTLDNRATEIVVGRSLTFDEEDMGFEQESTYMADFGPEGVSHSSDLGNGMLAVDVTIDGTGEWQELRVVNKKMGNLADYIRIEYDIYFSQEGVKNDGASNPYAVANPGWVKLGLEENTMLMKDLELVTMEGKDYYKHHVTIPIGGFISANELYIGIIGQFLHYEGIVYIDDIELFEERYIE